MLNGKVMIHNFIVGYIKKSISEYQGHKWLNVFQNRNLQEEEWKLN